MRDRNRKADAEKIRKEAEAATAAVNASSRYKLRLPPWSWSYRWFLLPPSLTNQMSNQSIYALLQNERSLEMMTCYLLSDLSPAPGVPPQNAEELPLVDQKAV